MKSSGATDRNFKSNTLEIVSRSSYVPTAPPHWRLIALSKRRADRCPAPGNADMDEVIKAKQRQQMAGSSLRAISIRGSREHNLKNIDLEIPRDKLVVFTGLRFRQILACLRHHLCRRPAALCRVAF